MRRRVTRGLAGLIVLGCLAGYGAWRGGLASRLLQTLGGGTAEPTPACTPLADVTPAACAVPDSTGVPPGLSLPSADSTRTPTVVPTVVILVPLAESGATPTP